MPVTAESANKPVASLMGVSKKIGSKTLVSDLTLDIPPGQIFDSSALTVPVKQLRSA